MADCCRALPSHDGTPGRPKGGVPICTHHPALLGKGRMVSGKVHKWAGERRKHRQVGMWVGWKESMSGGPGDSSGGPGHSVPTTPKT